MTSGTSRPPSRPPQQVCGKWFVPCAAGNQITICCLNSFTSVEFLIKVISEEVFAVVISCTRCYHGNHRFRQINWSYSASEGLQIWESILNSSNKQTPPPQLSSHLTQMSLNAALNYMNHVFHLSPTHDKPARGAQTNERNPEISRKITKTYLTLEDYWGKKHGFRAFKFFLPSSNP